MRARHEGARFDTDVFLIADGVLPAEVERGRAGAGRPGSSPRCSCRRCPGTEVRRAVGAERDRGAVLRRDGAPAAGRPVAATTSRSYLDLDFLDGTKGAHVNITGISGVATKTSYATFLLYSLFNSGVLGAEAANTKALIFNVKGEDLLFLDHANTAPRRRAGATATPRSACRPAPFRSVARARPAAARATRTPRPTSAPAPPGVHAVLLDDRTSSAREELLPFLFADAEDERQQYTMVVHNVTARLRDAPRQRRGDGAVRIDGDDRAHVPRAGRPHRGQADPDDDDRSTRAGPAGPSARARSTRSSAGSHGAVRHVEHLIRADVADADAPPHRPRRAAGHGRRPAQPPRPGQALRRRRRAAPGVRAQGGRRARPGRCSSSCSTSSTSTRPRDGVEPDQGDPARRRRARPQPRHHPDRRPADGERGRAAGRRQLAPSGSSAGSTPPRPAATSTASCRRVQRQRATILKPGTMFVSPARAAGAAARSSSRSRRGRPAPAEAGADAGGAGGRAARRSVRRACRR